MENGHGRIEWRGIAARDVTPAQMGFPHVAQVARIDRIRELKGARQEVETVWIITSLTADETDLARLLDLARQYWSIENGTHYPLDVSTGRTGVGCIIRLRLRCWVFSGAPFKVRHGPGLAVNRALVIAPAQRFCRK